MSMTRYLIFVGTFAAISLAAHGYLWKRLVRDPAWPRGVRLFFTAFLLLMSLALPLSFGVMRSLPRDQAQPLAFILFTWLGLFFFLFVGTLASDVFFGVRRLVTGKASETRRVFMRRAASLAVSGVALGMTGVAVAQAHRRVGKKTVEVPLDGLPEALDGFRIVQLSDVHIGPTIGRAFIEEIVETVNAADADAVVITGDLVDGSVKELREHAAPLAGLAGREGVYFCTGNHEYYSGADEWIAYLATLGIRTLRNERVTLAEERGGLDLAGVDDHSAHRFGGDHGTDVAKAVRGKPTDRKLVLLAHQPKTIAEAARHGVDLQLSGHTHGGQIVPFNLLVGIDQPYVAGLHDHDGTKIYVSRGTGYWGPPMRIGAPAEVTEIVLRRA